MSRVDELVRQIRREIEEEERKHPEAARAGAGRFEALRAASSLEALNRGLGGAPGEIRSHRRWIGPWIVAAKRVVRRVVLAVLEPELERERAFFRDAVRFSNEVAARCDELGRELEAEAKSLRARLDALEQRHGRSEPADGD